MYNCIITALFFFALCSQAQAQSQEQKQAIDSFDLIVNKFSTFFKSPQKLINKQAFSKSPSGVSVHVLEYSGTNLSYDIKKTESIISPFTAFIEIDVSPKSNNSCGNVFFIVGEKKYKTITGWDTEKGALDNSDTLKCYEPQLFFGRVMPSIAYRVKFEFAYQNNKWVFKAVTNQQDNNKAESTISGALGLYYEPIQPLTNKESNEFNAKWIALIN